jgi:hypothetical protein
MFFKLIMGIKRLNYLNKEIQFMMIKLISIIYTWIGRCLSLMDMKHVLESNNYNYKTGMYHVKLQL